MDAEKIKEKLYAYRRQKLKDDMTQSTKTETQTVLPWNANNTVEEPLLPATSDDDVEVHDKSIGLRAESLQDVQDTESTCSDDSIEQSQCMVVRNLMYLFYFLLWATLYVIAIKLEFGAVYFVVSTLLFICINTRTRAKKPGELSAYSVFNPNCEAIDGTLDVEQFEREIRFGIGSVR